jgi:hypothetical protein
MARRVPIAAEVVRSPSSVSPEIRMTDDAGAVQLLRQFSDVEVDDPRVS